MHRPFTALFRSLLVFAALAASAQVARSETPPWQIGIVELRTAWRFDELVGRLEEATKKHGMALVASASASRGAAARGVKIPGNAVLMVFRNDYAVRMLEASVAAGIEAPLRFYVTENADGSASLSYRTPTAVFAPYRNAKLASMAVELDPIFAAIARDAAAR